MRNQFAPAALVAASAFVCASLAIADPAPATPTYSKDVAPILNKNCAGCHRPGDIGPMPLLTYDQVRPWAKSIREKVVRGEMPPWHATQARGVFSNDRRLTDEEKDTLARWVAAGAPQGDPKDLPPAPKFVEGWEIGKPDAILTMAKPFHVPAAGTIAYQYVTIPTKFTEDKWIQAIEVRPGARSVVHHVLVFERDADGKPAPPPFTQLVPDMKALAPQGRGGEGGGAPQFPGTLIATTAPGTNAMVFAPGDALKIKAGATLLLQLHYTANGTPADDETSVGVIFAQEPPTREIRTSAFMNPMLRLPANAADTAIDSAIRFDQDVHLTAIFPHTHLRGKSWEYRLIYPDGHQEAVVSVPHYDFNWQTYYVFAKPLAIPKGSRLEATAHYDNSVNNKFNPDPNIEVHWGEQTWEEMQYTGITFYVDQPAGLPVTSASVR